MFAKKLAIYETSRDILAIEQLFNFSLYACNEVTKEFSSGKVQVNIYIAS